ncbi:MAG: hypothetical protein EOO41_00815 [Methanobacteriota archaeon]|nr:MAG: hypothetical protein EOO41_00815 [Euryarchaeota archaeon]
MQPSAPPEPAAHVAIQGLPDDGGQAARRRQLGAHGGARAHAAAAVAARGAKRATRQRSPTSPARAAWRACDAQLRAPYTRQAAALACPLLLFIVAAAVATYMVLSGQIAHSLSTSTTASMHVLAGMVHTAYQAPACALGTAAATCQAMSAAMCSPAAVRAAAAFMLLGTPRK